MEHALTTLKVEAEQAPRDADREQRQTPIRSERDLRGRARQAMDTDGEIDGIFLFGSRARRTAQPHSDWDIAIVSTNDDVPTLGTNVDTVRIDSKRLQRGMTTGSIEAVVMKYGRMIVRRKGWDTAAISEIPANGYDIEHDFKHIIWSIAIASVAMTQGSGREHQLIESDWSCAMSAGTVASHRSAKILGKQIATALGFTPQYGHNPGAIARHIHENATNPDVRQIAKRTDWLDANNAEQWNRAHRRYTGEPEAVWGLRTERTMKVLAEVIEGMREGKGPFAMLNTSGNAAPLRETSNAIENEIISRVIEVSTGRAGRTAGTAACKTLATLSRVVTQQADSGELEPKRDPFGKESARTVREATILCNATVLERARTEGVSAQDILVAGNPDTWEEGRNAIEFLAEHEDSYMRALTAYALADLGADIHGLAQRWEDAGETHAADAAQQGMTQRKARDPETAGKALRFATDKGWTDIVDEAIRNASINDIHRAMRSAATGAPAQPRPGTTATTAARHVLIINALRAGGGDPDWKGDGQPSARERPMISRARRNAFDDPEKARQIEAKGVRVILERTKRTQRSRGEGRTTVT